MFEKNLENIPWCEADHDSDGGCPESGIESNVASALFLWYNSEEGTPSGRKTGSYWEGRAILTEHLLQIYYTRKQKICTDCL